MPDPLRIFVSSTWEDLQPEREAVERTLHRMAQTDFTGMEHFGSRPETPRAESLAAVDRCHLYVGIFAHRYGSGITESEYRRARECDLPCLIYIIDEKAPVIPAHMEASTRKQGKLKKLKTELRKDHIVSTFKNPDDLAAQVAVDVGNQIATLRPSQDDAQFSRRHQLPADLADFTGREPQIERLVKILSKPGGAVAVSAINGLGGIGKTALAVHVAHKLKGDYPDAQIVVNLAGTTDPLSPAEAMAQTIHAFNPDARLSDKEAALAAHYRSTLADKRALLLFDNASDAAQVRDLIPAAPAAAIVTSRRTIVVPGVEPMSLDALPADKARVFLRTILPDPTRATDDQLDRIAERCARLPLALRAAASFLVANPTWTVDAYIEALTDEHQRLKRLEYEDLDVQAVLGLSAARLAEDNRTLAERWQMLSVFPASFDLAAAAAVTDTDESQARDDLATLHNQSLILYDPDTARYRLHDLLRLVAEDAFAYGGAAPDPDAVRARLHTAATRHAEHYRSVAGQANELYKQGNEGVSAGLALFDREWPNIEAGQFCAARHASDDDTAARLSSAYPDAALYCLSLRLHPRRRITWLESALTAAIRLRDRLAQGVHLGNLGNAYADLGETQRAVEYYEQRLDIASEIGDQRGEGTALGNLGNAYAELGETRRAIDYYEQHQAIAHEIGDKRGEVNALGNLGIAYAELGETRSAIEYYEQSMAIAREIGDKRGEGRALGNLGLACADLGETRSAIEYYEQSMAIAREIGDQRSEGLALSNLSVALDSLGRRPEAVTHATDALAIFKRIEDPNAAKVRVILAKWSADP